MRDAAFSLYALLRLGFTDEASGFMRWLSERMAKGGAGELGPLSVLYDIDGNVPHEQELTHLAGYRDSTPVRIGNGAVDQLQLDIYGELIDSVYLFNKYGKGISAETWGDLTRALEWLLEHWDEPDAGMWEIRNDPRHHTTSLLMCWVAIERMMRVARQRGLPGELSRWAEVRDEIYHRIMEDHWDEEVGAFMQHAGADTLDAGVLLMPMVKFLAPSDPRFLSTLAVDRGTAGLRQPGLPLRPGAVAPTASTGSRAPSRSAPSGTSRRSPAPAASTTPGWRWRRCSPTPTTSASTPSRSASPVSSSATSPRPSPTCR